MIAKLTRFVAILALCAFSLPAQDAPKPQTTDLKITPSVLEKKLAPMLLADVQVEVDGWVAELVKQNKAVSDKQIEAEQATGAAKSTAQGEIQTLSDERVRLLDRVNVALAAFEAKGGDRAEIDKYIAASTGTAPDWFDPTAVWAYVVGWALSPEGGIRLLMNILKFIATLIVFKFLGSILSKIVQKAVSRMKGSSELLRDFFVNTVRKVTFFIGIIVALSMLEVNIGPFVAAIGAAGFVIGFALQGTLSNFAAGIMILVYRPYDIGEVVTVAGTTGKVDAMSLVSTTLRLPDNQAVVVPNNSIWGDVITNITGAPTRRVDMVFGCGYDDDLQKTQDLLMEIVTAHPKVHADPAPVVKVHELADSSVNFVVRPWANTGDYWDIYWDVTREVKDRFDKAGISIPYPQQDVHMHNAS